ncbi:MAG: hypothetical protein Q9226_008721 [Calogaya cf. arnoldii]
MSETFSDQLQAKYWDDLRQLQEHMPHLQNVGKRSRAHDQAHFESFDYSNGNLIASETHNLHSTASKAAKEFAVAILDHIPSETDTRLLVVDDLSSMLITILSTCLGIGLVFFEDYLVNTGWHNDQYDDMAPATWNTTKDLVKNYVSLRWYRPVQARALRPRHSQGSLNVLEPSQTPDTWMQIISQEERISHYTQPLVNVIRMPWEAKLDSGGFSAWEERASVWSTRVGQCRIMVLLLDPMPLITHTEVVQHRQREQSLYSSEISERSNSDDNRNHGYRPRSGFFGLVPWFRKIFELGTSSRMGPEAMPPTESQRESGSHSSTQSSLQEGTQPASSFSDRCMFTAYSNRVPLMNYNDTLVIENTEQLTNKLRHMDSTSDTPKLLLRPHQTFVADRKTSSTPLGSLLTITIHDTFKILRSIDLILTQLDFEMLDDVLVQVKIDDWRRMLYKFPTELRSMETSIPDFADFVVVAESSNCKLRAGKDPTFNEELLIRFGKEVARAQARVKSNHRSLMTTMSLIESKRGISEAESVTKLTELAFFFIPLTFAASLFSMQVKELDAGTTLQSTSLPDYT